MSSSNRNELISQLENLSEAQIAVVFSFVRGLVAPQAQGTPPSELEELFGIMPAEDAAEMERIIEEGCERIDYETW